MTTWYEAHENIIQTANDAMDAAFAQEDIDQFQRIWRETAQALKDSIPEEFERDWPELYAIAQELGPDFVGVTSDTRKVVGSDNGKYKKFAIYEAPTPAEVAAAEIKAWDRKSVYELRDMLRDLNSLTEDGESYIDMTSLPTAAIPDDVDTTYPVWAIDYVGNMLVGDAADDIMSLNDYRANRGEEA